MACVELLVFFLSFFFDFFFAMAPLHTLSDDLLFHIFFMLCSPIRPKETLSFVHTCERLYKMTKTNVTRLRKASCVVASLIDLHVQDDEVCCDQITSNKVVEICEHVLQYATITGMIIGKQHLGHNGPYPGVEGTRVIAKSLETNSVLTKLHLIGQECGTLGVIALSEALHRNRVLKDVNISYNLDIGTEAGIALGRMLAVNQTLAVLSMRQSSIYAKGAVAIANALMTNKTLRNLDMECTKIGLEGMVAVFEAWKMHERSYILFQTDRVDQDACDAYLQKVGYKRTA